MSGFVVSAAFKLVDQFSSQADKIGSHADRLGSKFDRLKSRAGNLKNMAVGAIGGLIAGFSVGTALKEAASEEALLGKYQQALQRALPRIAASQAQIEEVISRGSARLGTDYEDALGGVGATMLKFQNLTGRNLLRAIDITFDLAAKSGAKTSAEFESIAQKVGSSMNNPVRALRAFKSEGAAFTTEQTKMVQAMVRANDVVGAQGIIMDGLAKAVGGAAAEFEHFQPINFTHNRLATVTGDLWARAGEAILTVAHGPIEGMVNVLVRLEGNLKKIVTSGFMGWIGSVSAKAAVATTGALALAAAIGVTLVGALLTLSSPITVITGLLTALRVVMITALSPLLLNPYVAAIAAAATAVYLLYENWELVKASAASAVAAVRSGIDAVGGVLNTASEAAGVGSLSRGIGSVTRDFLGMAPMKQAEAAPPVVNVSTVVNVDKDGKQTSNTTSSLKTGQNLPINVSDSAGY